MTDEDKKAFAALVIGAAEVCFTKLSRQALGVYWKALLQFEYCDVESAVNRYMSIKPTVKEDNNRRKMFLPSDIILSTIK